MILESKSIKDKKVKDKQETIDKIGKVTKDVAKGVYNGALDAPKNIAQNIGKQFGKNKVSSDKSEE